MTSMSPPPLAIAGLTPLQNACCLAWTTWAFSLWALHQNQWDRWATWFGGGVPLDA